MRYFKPQKLAFLSINIENSFSGPDYLYEQTFSCLKSTVASTYKKSNLKNWSLCDSGTDEVLHGLASEWNNAQNVAVK